MAAPAVDMEDALERLTRLLPSAEPELWSSLRPPVSDADLDLLRHSVAPFEVPQDVVSLLKWKDGQRRELWWPPLERGPLVPAAGAAKFRAFLIENTWLDDVPDAAGWNPLWLPVVQAGHCQAGVEMTADHPGAVIDGSFPDGNGSILAPSLAAVFDMTARMLEEGISLGPPDAGPDVIHWMREVRALSDGYEQWHDWPYDRNIAPRVSGWPPHWRTALGLPAETDLVYPDPVPIVDVLTSDSDEPVSIEGFVVGRVLLDGQATGPAVITFDDGSGAIHVLVEHEVPGSFWASTLGTRAHVDVSTGPAARRRLGTVIGAHPARRAQAPAGTDAVAHAVRYAIQRPRRREDGYVPVFGTQFGRTLEFGLGDPGPRKPA